MKKTFYAAKIRHIFYCVNNYYMSKTAIIFFAYFSVGSAIQNISSLFSTNIVNISSFTPNTLAAKKPQLSAITESLPIYSNSSACFCGVSHSILFYKQMAHLQLFHWFVALLDRARTLRLLTRLQIL